MPGVCKWFGVRLRRQGHVTGHICAWRESDPKNEEACLGLGNVAFLQ